MFYGRVIGYENHPNDSRVTESGAISQTLSSRMGTGGGNCPIVLISRTFKKYLCRGYGRRKKFISDNDGCHTDIVYNARRRASDSFKEKKCKIIKLWAGDGDKLKVRTNYNGRKGGNGFGISEDGVSYTLTAVDRHLVFYIKKENVI